MHSQPNPRNLEALLVGRNNNFGLIRHLAALSVLYGHSFIFWPNSGGTDAVRSFTGIEYSGSLAVFAFFFLSGILVSQSWTRQDNVKNFVALRFSRIWPALFVCVTLIVFVGAPVFSNLPYSQFISNKETVGFFVKNITLFDGVRFSLPGVFEHNAIRAVNGALWTLPVEIGCYCIVLCLGLLRFSKTRLGAMIGVMLTFAGWLALFRVHPPGAMLNALVSKPGDFTAYPVIFFLCGFIAFHFRSLVVIRLDVAAILCVLYLLNRFTEAGHAIFYVAFIYLILVVAASPYLRKYEPSWDISYGIYVYGFFVQQCFAALFPAQNVYVGLLMSVVASVILASLSWRFIEQPAITFTRRWLGKKSAVPAPWGRSADLETR
jgi:peptidoglycan/LPS O-acetylase OafA/YrhL